MGICKSQPQKNQNNHEKQETNRQTVYNQNTTSRQPDQKSIDPQISHNPIISLKHEKATMSLSIMVQEHKKSIYKEFSLLEKGFKQTSIFSIFIFTLQASKIIVQHNLTGVIKQAVIISKENHKASDFAKWVLQNNLVHPNIAFYQDIYSDQQNYYFVQDYCSGMKLDEFLKVMKKISDHQAVTVVKKIVQSIKFLHSKEIFHGSLTMECFQFADESSDFNIKLIDLYPLFEKQEFHSNQIPFMSPEYASKGLRRMSDDIWAIGMITHKLLTGFLPFDSKNQKLEQVKKNILRGYVNLESTEFEKVPTKAKEFLKKMLNPNPQQRYDAKHAEYDQWLASSRKILRTEGKKTTIENLFKNKLINQLQAAILLFMANHYYSQQQQQLFAMFDDMDVNKDQKLSKAEIVQAYSKLYAEDIAIAQVDHLFSKIDTNGDGQLEFEEFVIANIDKSALITNQKLEETFRMIDADKNGQITVKEIQSLFKIEAKLIRKLMNEVDKDNNEKVIFIIKLLVKYNGIQGIDAESFVNKLNQKKNYMNIQSPQITTGSQGSKSKQQSFIFQNRPKRVDKFKNPIIKGIHGKMVTFRDQFDTTKPVHDIVIVERIVYPEPKQNKCACACIIQ